MMTYQDYLDRLKKNVCVVSFNKVNGDQRVMTCTLEQDKLPPANKKDPLSLKKVREINENVVSVWDINAQSWRSFRVANVTGFEVLYLYDTPSVCINYCYEKEELKYYPSCHSLDDEYQSSIESMFLSQQSDYKLFDVKIVNSVINDYHKVVNRVGKFAYDKFIDAFNKHINRTEGCILHLSNTIHLDKTCTSLTEMQNILEHILDKIDLNKLHRLEFHNKKIINEITNDEMLINFAKKYDTNHVKVEQLTYTPEFGSNPLWKSVVEILYDVRKN